MNVRFPAITIFLIACMIVSHAKAVVVTSPQVFAAGFSIQDREDFDKAFKSYYSALVEQNQKIVEMYLVAPAVPAHLGRLLDKKIKDADGIVVTMIHYNVGWLNRNPAFSTLIFIVDKNGTIIGAFVDVWFMPKKHVWQVMHFEDSDFIVLGARLG